MEGLPDEISIRMGGSVKQMPTPSVGGPVQPSEGPNSTNSGARESSDIRLLMDARASGVPAADHGASQPPEQPEPIP